MYYFDKVATYHKIDGFVYHYSNSFPSGHATTCFAIFTVLAYLHAQTNLARILCFVFALLFSLTRVYLSQHFIIDVIAGATIGYLTTLLILKLSENKFEKLEVPLFQRK
jgi:membrane-associated phospholipid phosphatase